MFTHVLGSLKRIGKIAIATDQYGHIIEVVPGEVQHVCSQHDIDAFLHWNALRKLHPAQANLQVRRLLEHVQKLLLLPEAIRPLIRVLKDIVVVSAEQWPPRTELVGEIGEVEVNAAAVVAQCMV